MKSTLFDYDLPDSLIARVPIKKREDARLLVMNRTTGDWQHRHFFNLPDHLKSGDLLVLNDTRVIPARLFARRENTGARVEFFLLEELSNYSFSDWSRISDAADIPRQFFSKNNIRYVTRWRVLLRPANKVKALERFLFEFRSAPSTDFFAIAPVQPIDKVEREIWLFSKEPVLEMIMLFGQMPLPPYLKREAQAADQEDYQTVYAEKPGAVAAPTAGLHFSCALLDALRDAGVGVTRLTLHVGYGTFKPVETEDIESHRLHAEQVILSQDAAGQIQEAKAAGRRVIACGTTVVRALESAFLLEGKVKAGTWKTDMFIYPPFHFQVIDGLITNFHLPRSSLLMLVAAWAGREAILAAYQEAIARQYRFYSYGDGMLIV